MAEKQAWEGRLAAAPVSLAHCPRAVAEKALAVIAALERGESYLAFKGKRLTAMGRRDLVSIPLGWRYRLLARIQAAGLQILEVLSHEAYNTRLAANRWPT
ncbi:ParE family toxin-like protein [Nitrospira sp. Kam-Ns4a]